MNQTDKQNQDAIDYDYQRLATLHQRIQFLETRIRIAKRHGIYLNRHIQEVMALRWVLEKANLSAPPSRENHAL